MIQWGISAMSHDAAIAVIKDETEILFAAHSERYSRKKNDGDLNDAIILAALEYGYPDEIIWYERPMKKRARQFKAGQYKLALLQEPVSHYLFDAFSHLLDRKVPLHFVDHHLAHAAAGYYTSPYKDAMVLVVDSIGEFDTVSIWEARDGELKKVFSEGYPNSVGLFYSAMTKRAGLKPNEEEYILMGMAAYGKPTVDMHEFVNIDERPYFTSKLNFHRGVNAEFAKEVHPYDIAASAQNFVEQYLQGVAAWMRTHHMDINNLVFMGGVALNCVANSHIAGTGLGYNMWIMPNPGDAGSCIGAVAAFNQHHVNWQTPYLGTNIDRPFDEEGMFQALVEGKIIAVANGRAEFGPRALGNRSLLADPRGPVIKDRVNDIKLRERFRPFAPIIMEEYVHEYFDMPVETSPYMQYTAHVWDPVKYPAITHVDGTARVQTVNEKQHPNMYRLLKRFYERTGCPMLLNTSLNIKGEPLVDTWDDALRFHSETGVPIY